MPKSAPTAPWPDVLRVRCCGTTQGTQRSAFLGSRAGCSPPDTGSRERLCGHEGSKCLFARLSKEAALSSLPPCLWRKPDAWFFRYVSLCLLLSVSWSLSQSLPATEQREGNFPWPLIFPHWPRPGHHGLGQKQQQPVQLLDYEEFASSSPEWGASAPGKGEEEGHRLSSGQAKYRPAARR